MHGVGDTDNDNSYCRRYVIFNIIFIIITVIAAVVVIITIS